MCVIAGYIGDKQAAPILLEMLKREEGFDAGYYSGLATIHKGKLYCAKVVGDCQTLIDETDAKNLPGTIGIIHSRTPGGGGQQWAHPFTNNQTTLAYIANGSGGSYINSRNTNEIIQKLIDSDYRFKSAQDDLTKVGSKHPKLPDGRPVHISDIMCQLVDYEYKRKKDNADRLLNASIAGQQIHPSSIVALSLHAAHPDEIVVVRHNQPMQVGRSAAGEIFLATTTLAFSDGVNWDMRMPANSGARFNRDGLVQVIPFTDKSILPVASMPSYNFIKQNIVEPLCEQGIRSMKEIFADARPASLWPEGMLGQGSNVVYETLSGLAKEGKISFTEQRHPGMFDKGTVPKIKVHWQG